jgi:hypothetical protein
VLAMAAIDGDGHMRGQAGPRSRLVHG